MNEKRIMIPLNIDNHWFLAYIEPNQDHIYIYNSQSADIYDEHDETAIINLALFFKLRLFREFTIIHEECPKQNNQFDCGFFCKFKSI